MKLGQNLSNNAAYIQYLTNDAGLGQTRVQHSENPSLMADPVLYAIVLGAPYFLGLWTIICILKWSRSNKPKWCYTSAFLFVCTMISFMTVLLAHVIRWS